MIFFENTLVTVISLSTPLIIAVIGETISEKGGVINLSAEGTIMICALFGFMMGFITNIAILGFIFAIFLGAFISFFISYCDIRLRMDQIAVGFVLTILLARLSSYLGQDYVRINGPMITKIEIPLLSKIPFLGELPLVQSIREAGDIGRPAAMQEKTVVSNAFTQVTRFVVSEVVLSLIHI